MTAGVWKTVLFIFVSPLLGFLLGSILMVVVAHRCRRSSPLRVDNRFRRLRLVSAGPYSQGTAVTSHKRPSASLAGCRGRRGLIFEVALSAERDGGHQHTRAQAQRGDHADDHDPAGGLYRAARQSFGGDSNRIYVSGHSSGGHLAGVVLTTDWRKEFNLPVDAVKGGLCCSGLFDLKAVRLSARSAYVKFTDEIEQSMSSQRRLELLNAPLVLAYGTLETPEFQRQTRDFAAAVQAAGKSMQLLVGEGYNHFEIIETMAHPYGLLGRAVLEQMKLTGA